MSDLHCKSGPYFSENTAFVVAIPENSRIIHALEYALPKVKKRKAADVSDKEHASSSGAKQMPIQQSMQAAGSLGVDQALAVWVYEQGIPFNVFR